MINALVMAAIIDMTHCEAPCIYREYRWNAEPSELKVGSLIIFSSRPQMYLAVDWPCGTPLPSWPWREKSFCSTLVPWWQRWEAPLDSSWDSPSSDSGMVSKYWLGSLLQALNGLYFKYFKFVLTSVFCGLRKLH